MGEEGPLMGDEGPLMGEEGPLMGEGKARVLLLAREQSKQATVDGFGFILKITSGLLLRAGRRGEARGSCPGGGDVHDACRRHQRRHERPLPVRNTPGLSTRSA